MCRLWAVEEAGRGCRQEEALSMSACVVRERERESECVSWCVSRAWWAPLFIPPYFSKQTSPPPFPFSLLASWERCKQRFCILCGLRVPPFFCLWGARTKNAATTLVFLLSAQTKQSRPMSDEDVECPKRLLEESCKPACTKYALAYEVRRERERRGRGKAGRPAMRARRRGCAGGTRAFLCDPPTPSPTRHSSQSQRGGGEVGERVCGETRAHTVLPKRHTPIPPYPPFHSHPCPPPHLSPPGVRQARGEQPGGPLRGPIVRLPALPGQVCLHQAGQICEMIDDVSPGLCAWQGVSDARQARPSPLVSGVF